MSIDSTVTFDVYLRLQSDEFVLFLIGIDIPMNSTFSHKLMLDITPAMTYFACFLTFSRRYFCWTHILRYKRKDCHGYQPHPAYILAIIFCRDIWGFITFQEIWKNSGNEKCHPVYRNSNQGSNNFVVCLHDVRDILGHHTEHILVYQTNFPSM
jgi:hypothetical protein